MKIGLKTIRALAIMIVMVLTVSAMSALLTGSPATGTVSAADEGYVSVGWLSEVVNWNPLAMEMVEDYVVCYLVYSALFTYDQDWNGPVYDLATGYTQEVSPVTGMMWTNITITDTAYFRNAANLNDMTHPVTAADVAFSFWTMKNNSGGAFDWYLQEVDNIIATSTYTVSMTTSYAKSTLIDDIASLPILPKYIWQNDKTPLGSMTPGELVGSGPFVFESYLKGSWYKFKVAPNYHGSADYGAARTVSIQGILYTVYTSTTALTTAINTGVEDFAVLTGDMRSFQENLGVGSSVNVYKAAVQEPGICDIAINAIPSQWVTSNYGAHHRALDDPNVRKAIMMTLNKDYIVNTTLGGYAKIGSSVVQPGYWQTTIKNQLPYDPAAAKVWLQDHGWSADADGDGYLEANAGNAYGVPAGTELSAIRCQAPDTDPTYGTITEAWKGWAKLAGIGFTSTVESEITMINIAWYKADYDIWVWHWGWGPEPLGGALSVWLSSEITTGGDNCQMPMGPWWCHEGNLTSCPYVSQAMIDKYDILNEDTWNGRFSSFDQNISDAMTILDKEERKVYIDRLQQQVYDSYSENPPFYDLGLYGYTDQNFDNWGDVAGHSGLNVASDLLWIWFNVKQVTNRAPVFNTVPEDSYLTFNVADVMLDVTIAVSDSEGDTIDIDFDWGDGTAVTPKQVVGATTATDVIASHHYYVAGVYTLTVSITDNYVDPVTGLRDPVVRTSMVEVQEEINMAPDIVSLVSSPLTKAYVETVTTWTLTATDTESWPDGAKVTWDWDDGSYDVVEPVPSGLQIASALTHTWNIAGSFVVEVSVYDNIGLESGDHNVSTTRDYSIVTNQPPTTPVIQAMNGLVSQALTCVASSSDADGDPLRFTWDWDDGTYSVQDKVTTAGVSVTSTVSHTWDTAGTYTVTVYVDDGQDHNVSATRDAVIYEGNAPPGSFELAIEPSPVYIDIATTFNASASDANGDVLVLTIDFGDGSNNLSATTDGGVSESQYAEFEHTYTEAATYTVTVYADDGEFNESAEFTVVVADAALNVAPVLEVQSSYQALYNVAKTYQPVSVSDADHDTVTVWFDWGDDTAMSMGDPANGNSSTHTYMATGTFTLTVYADDGMGHNVSETASVSVSEANQRAGVSILADYAKITAGGSVMFTVSVSDLEGDAITVNISFGDGSIETTSVDPEAAQTVKVYFNHTFADSGEFIVTATADDGQSHYNTTLKSAKTTVTVEAKGVSMMLIAGIALVLIAGIVAAVLLMKRKKGGAATTSDGGSDMEGMAPPEEPPPPSA